MIGNKRNINLSLINLSKVIYAALRAAQVALVVKNPPANTGDARHANLIPGLRRSPGEENGNPLHYSCLENSIDSGYRSKAPKTMFIATLFVIAPNWKKLKCPSGK